MCAVIGALLWPASGLEVSIADSWVANLIVAGHARGRDGRGWIFRNGERIVAHHSCQRCENPSVADIPTIIPHDASGPFTVLGNLRAEPTTEYVAEKSPDDQQPYVLGGWAIVHNGTIANDKELRDYKLSTSIDSAAIVELLNRETPSPSSEDELYSGFCHAMEKLQGSYAIMATHENWPNIMLVSVNYRPVWFVKTEVGWLFASGRDYFPANYNPQMLTPYSHYKFTRTARSTHVTRHPHGKHSPNRKALVVCSGGLDSVVAATVAQRKLGYAIELLHFQYGCRAEGPEVKAIRGVAEALGVKARFFPLPIYDKEDSPLFDHDSPVAGGEAGAEFAHEWVPARNLVFLSVAAALAEAGGFETLVLGNNLEEAGAYPDNEPEFIDRFNDLLPFAVGDGKRLKVIMPVGNLMKHEIVKLGYEVGAPMDKTWSCYRAHDVHCGTCGPCYMRRTAFAINHLPEVIRYETDKETQA